MPANDPVIGSLRLYDLSTRIVSSTTVVASPAAGSETVIGSVTIPSGLNIITGVLLFGWAAFTVGTSGVSANLKIRQTSVSGTTLSATGATTGGISAGNLVALDVGGIDTSPGDAQIYKLTLLIGSGAAASTVTALQLVAIAV